MLRTRVSTGIVTPGRKYANPLSGPQGLCPANILSREGGLKVRQAPSSTNTVGAGLLKEEARGRGMYGQPSSWLGWFTSARVAMDGCLVETQAATLGKDRGGTACIFSCSGMDRAIGSCHSVLSGSCRTHGCGWGYPDKPPLPVKSRTDRATWPYARGAA